MTGVQELEALRAQIEGLQRLKVDPLGFVDREASETRKELVAFVAAGLAFGNVKAIGQSVGRVLAHLDNLSGLGEAGHRWVRGADLRAVLGRIAELQSKHGTLGRLFEAGYEPGDIRGGMTRFSEALREGLERTRGVVTLTTSPTGGSACKRMNLFLRWMVRRDGVDLGLWRGVEPADLIMPLDVHVVAYARRFGLTRRRAQDWKMAEEITAFFRQLCPGDPLRYDFAISHYGMMNSWSV